MKEKLQSIIDGKIEGEDAVAILRSALKEHGSMSDKSFEFGQLIGMAEDAFIYGKEGRPLHKTYR
jgi:hypothetical protein